MLNRGTGWVVYNFEVEDHHTYFVGNAYGGVWVHSPICPNDIQFSQGSIGSTFTHGDWAGRPLQEAIDETKRLGRLPDGLSIEVMAVNGQFVTLNNRTLYVAQQAGLSRVAVTDVGPGGWNSLQKLLKDTTVPLPLGSQPTVR
jgi:hypothetical protein